MRDQLVPWAPILLTEGLKQLSPLPRARAALGSALQHGGRSIVITSRLPHVAQAMTEGRALRADTVIGGLTGAEKLQLLPAHDVLVYVGDHTLGMCGAKLAGCTAVDVLAGYQTERELCEAGADFVPSDLIV